CATVRSNSFCFSLCRSVLFIYYSARWGPPLTSLVRWCWRFVHRRVYAASVDTRSASLRSSKLVRPAGLEPATPGLGNRCSILLSYGRVDDKHLILLEVIRSGTRPRLLRNYRTVPILSLSAMSSFRAASFRSPALTMLYRSNTDNSAFSRNSTN